MEIAHSEFRNVREASWFHLTLEADFLVLQDANPKLGSFFLSLIPEGTGNFLGLVSGFYCFIKKTVIYV